MHALLLTFVAGMLFSLVAGGTFAQVNPEAMRDKASQTQGKGSGDQPQNNPSNLETKPGQAPASSPQGETPGGMQSAPKGSQGTNTENKK